MKILVPVDLIQPVQPIINALKALVALSQADVKLLFVRELLPAYENLIRTAGSFPDDWDKEMDVKASQALEQTAAAFKPHCRSVTAQLSHGPAAMMIETFSRDEGFDMTVVAPRRQNATERFFSGSVSSKVVQHASGTILVTRPESIEKSGKLTSVVFGYDGSENAKYAIAHALQQFPILQHKPKITIVHAIDLAEPIKLFSPVSFVSSLEQNLLMHGETLLAEAEKQIIDAGISNVDLCLTEGDAAAEVIKMANESNAELIVTGAQGRSAVEHFLVGSVSQKISIHAACSVAIVKQNSK